MPAQPQCLAYLYVLLTYTSNANTQVRLTVPLMMKCVFTYTNACYTNVYGKNLKRNVITVCTIVTPYYGYVMGTLY